VERALDTGPYHVAQRAMADLKAAIYDLLASNTGKPLKNAEIGRSLGIYSGHVEHEGHISRTLLEIMKVEGVVEQDPETKLWSLKRY
jgi:DNA-binding IclR family transcriptional regulator